MAGLDGLDQVVGGVVDALEDVCIALSVGSPLHDDLVETVGSLELPNYILDQTYSIH